MSKLLSKAEAAAALGISVSTLKRRMVNKTIEYTTAPQSRPGEATVWFTFTQLGLPEPSSSGFEEQASGGNYPPVQPAAISLPYQDEPATDLVARPEPEITAENRHEFRDSMGNKLGDPDPVSLLGPSPRVERDSTRDLRYQPIHWFVGDDGKLKSRKQTVYVR